MTEDLNNIILKKYISKYYKFYKISSIFKVSIKTKLYYSILEIADNKEKSIWVVKSFICKIFSTDIIAVNKAFNEVLIEEIDRLKQLQLNLVYEGYSN